MTTAESITLMVVMIAFMVFIYKLAKINDPKELATTPTRKITKTRTTMTNEDFVSYDLAMRLKQAGFDRPCNHYYTKENTSDGDVWLTTAAFSPEDWNNNRNGEPDFLKPLCSAPTLWEAQKWLRGRGLCVSVYPSPYSEDINGECAYKVYQFMDSEEWNDPWTEYAKDYESALSAGIEAALDILTNKIKDL